MNLRYVLLFLFLLLGRGHALSLTQGTSLAITLTPHSGVGSQRAGVSVSYRLRAAPSHDALQLRFDTLEPSLQRTTDQVNDLYVKDASGALHVEGPIKLKQQKHTWQVWTSSRAPTGTVSVTYFVPVAQAHPSKRGPHIDLQAAGGGVSGALESLLLLPDIPGPIDLSLHWHLSPQQIGVSTFATGDVRTRTTLDKLEDTLFLAGPVVTAPRVAPAKGFSMSALGVNRASLQSAYSWSRKAYEAERIAFHGSPDSPFRFMIRSYDGGAIDSGHANNGSFLLYLPPSLPPDAPEIHDLIAHEMVHVFTQELTGDPEAQGDWYTEGIADYFKILLPEAAHLYSREQYLQLVNQEAALYYTNRNRELSNEQASLAKWSQYGAWSLLYTRGTLYLADLDAKLLSHRLSVRVLELVNTMNDRIRAGAPRTDETWIDLLREQAGQWAVEDWMRMRAGDVLYPVAGAFGACLVASPIQVGFFDLGYAPAKTSAGTLITQVTAQSHAAKAGLLPGDRILRPVDDLSVASSFNQLLRLTIRRGNQTLSVAYDPHTDAQVKAMRWQYKNDSEGCR